MKLRNKFRQIAKKIFVRAIRSPGLSPYLFRFAKLFASLVRVDKIFITRAEHIFEIKHSPTNAIRFLSCYARLKLKMDIPGFPYNIAAQLETDAEKIKTLEIFHAAIEIAKSDFGYEALQIQIFRLQNKSANDPEIASFASKLIQNSINKKTGGGIKKDSSKALKQDGLEALLEIKKRFKAHNKKFFLISGTLLGVVREKDFISNDIDIDIGVFADDISKDELRQILLDSSFYLKDDFEYKLGYLSKDGVDVEFFFLHKIQNKLVIRGFGGIIEWHFTPFELEERNFLGHMFPVPGNIESYLEENFGNWRKPPLFYNYIFDTPCHRVGNNSHAMLYFSLVLRNAIQRGNRFTAEKAAEILNEQFNIDYTNRLPGNPGQSKITAYSAKEIQPENDDI